MSHLSDELQQEQGVSSVLAQAFLRHLTPPAPGLFAFRSWAVSSGLYPNQAHWTSKTPIFKPHWLQEFMKMSPSCFPRQWLCGSVFIVCSSVSPFLSRTFIQDHSFLPSAAPTVSFSSKPYLCISTFFDVASSFRVVVEFVLSSFRLIFCEFRML